METADLFTIGYMALGGLGIFFLGLRSLSDSLQRIAGDVIRKIIARATSNRILAVLVGIVVTTIIQSSSISTVMVVGLVNAGLMDLAQAIGVILGANIGTTITGWILAIKIGKYGMLLIGLGVFPALFSKRDKVAAIGGVILALGLVFFGLELMSNAFKPLRSNEDFIAYLAIFSPETTLGLLGCILSGCILTLIVQSSSAMLGITIALAVTGTLDFQTAVALVLGENIGTTITALLASMGANLSARRAAYSHAMFNVTGVVIMFFIFHPFVAFVDSLIPGQPDVLSATMEKPVIAAHIAAAHSLFNVTAVLIMLPFLRTFASFVERMVPGKVEDEGYTFRYLGTPGNVSSEVSINMAESELLSMTKSVSEILEKAEQYLRSEKENSQIYDEVGRLEELTDTMQTEITSFVCQTMEGKLNNEQSNRAYSLIRLADELESLADYSHSVCRFRRRLFRNEQDFSEAGWEDVSEFFLRVRKLYGMIIDLMENYDKDNAEIIPAFGKSLTEYGDTVRGNHLERMRNGKCKPLSALVFSDMIVGMRRIKNHSINVFDVIEHNTQQTEDPVADESLEAVGNETA